VSWGGWIGVAALLYPWGAMPREGPTPSIAERLVGPIASLAASVQWVRFDMALDTGRPERAYALAESALGLAPRAAPGWLTLGRHLITVRGSAQDEPDPERRARWMRAGLDTFERGEGVAIDAGELAFARGLYLAGLIAGIPAEELSWPGGAEAALDEAELAFERAWELGHPRAAMALEVLRARRSRK